ncbi:MAG: SDR family oxidoreductase [Thermodesulfovibrionales bacterium]
MAERALGGQAALVTGASSGIGAAVAMAMGRAGAQVAVNFFSDEAAAVQVASAIKEEGGKAFTVRADVSDEAQVIGMFDAVRREFGTLDILVSNAGVQKDSPFAEMDAASWRAVIEINLTGSFLCAREAVREFLRRGPVPARSRATGKIIFVSSVHEAIPWAGHANYAASKGGVMQLMRTIAQEMAPKKIRANSIAPGAIRTPINRGAWDTPEAEARLLELIPYGRVGEAEDVARVAVWLASEEADYVNGATIFVDGGMMLFPGFAHGG